MMLSSLLDVINKRIQQGKPLDNATSITGAVMEFVNLIEHAEKFDFGTLRAEQIEEREFLMGKTLPFFKLPTLTNEEIQFWLDGLLPLPADICWYEFRVCEDKGFCSTSGLLVRKREEGIFVQRIEYNQKGASDYMVDGTWVQFLPDQRIRWYNEDDMRFRQLSGLSQENVYNMFGSSAIILIYLTLMINSKTTEVRRVVPTPKQQSLRRQLRKSPLPEHTTVTIVPQRFIDEAREADGVKGTHASPRIHWRRSHVRVYNRDLPNEYKRVIPRMIIGRRELGEVKHDYVVRMK